MYATICWQVVEAFFVYDYYNHLHFVERVIIFSIYICTETYCRAINLRTKTSFRNKVENT